MNLNKFSSNGVDSIIVAVDKKARQMNHPANLIIKWQGCISSGVLDKSSTEFVVVD